MLKLTSSRWLHLLQWFFCVSGVGFLVLTQSNCLPVKDPREKLEELRVLGVKAEPPAAKPGDKVTLSALTANPENAATTLSWYLCASPEAAADGCPDTDGALSLGTGTSVSLTVPADYLNVDLTPAEKQNGRYLVVTLVAKTDQETVVSTKRVVVSQTPNNKNPTIVDLKLFDTDGSTALSPPWSLKLESNYKLEATVSPESRDTYPRTDLQGNTQDAKERLYLSWYLTEGSYEKGYLSKADDLSNVLQTPKEAPNKDLTLYLILRDGRGGVDWKTFQTKLP